MAETTNAGGGVGKGQPSFTVGGTTDCYSHNGNHSRLLKTPKISLLYDPAVPFFGISPKYLASYSTDV